MKYCTNCGCQCDDMSVTCNMCGEHFPEWSYAQKQSVSSNVDIKNSATVSMGEKMEALTKLLQDKILTAEEFARVVSALSGTTTSSTPVKKETPLEKQYNEVFSKHIINAFKSPSMCKWPELDSNMIKQGLIKIDSATNEYKCTYIETYIDAPNSYGAMLRKTLRLVISNDGSITRVLQEKQTNSVTLLGTISNAMNIGVWCDLVRLPNMQSYTKSGFSNSDYWICRQCADKNPVSARTCRGCGSYR